MAYGLVQGYGGKNAINYWKITFHVRKIVLRLCKTGIDLALWTIVEDTNHNQLHEVQTFGYVLTYVDDFLIVGTQPIRSRIEEEIARIWSCKLTGNVDQYNIDNPAQSLTFLSTTIRSPPDGGFLLDQELFVKDLLSTWQMTESNSSVAPGDPSGLEMSLETPEEDIDVGDVWKAQKIAGSLNWLSTRTRPDISYGQSRVSSMATTNPKQAILEGKRILR